MERLEFELETRDAAEGFRNELEAKVPKTLRTERVVYHGAQTEYFHLSILKRKTLTGSFSFEKDGKKYACTLDLRKLPEVQIEVPVETFPAGTFEFIRYLRQGYIHDGTKGTWAQEGFKTRGGLTLNPTLGRSDETAYFAHQSISREDGTLALRYDIESDDKLYLCHLDIRMTKEEHERIFNLFDLWIHHFFTQKFSGQKTPHHTSPQPASELVKST